MLTTEQVRYRTMFSAGEYLPERGEEFDEWLREERRSAIEDSFIIAAQELEAVDELVSRVLYDLAESVTGL